MLSLRIALRYLLSRKSHGAVNVISAISLAAIAVAAAAMVIVLSVFNGFSQLAESKLSAIDPDFMLTPEQGKMIPHIGELLERLDGVEGLTVAPEITEQAFAVGAGAQMPVTLKGMTQAGLAASGIPGIIIDGKGSCFLSDSSAILSVGAAIGLELRPSAELSDLTVYEPRRVGRINPANPMAAFRSARLQAQGVFQVEQEEYDRDVIVVPFDVAARLLACSDEATSIAVHMQPGADASSAVEALRGIASAEGLVVKDRHQQQQQAFRMISIEKWITFMMLAFILVIASCNIISTLSMLILEKEDNMAILAAMGATRRLTNGIFTTQGWLIVVLGGLAGMLAGTLLVLGQQHFGWIKLAAADPALMSVDTYPVILLPADLLATAAILIAIAVLITPVIPLLRRSER